MKKKLFLASFVCVNLAALCMLTSCEKKNVVTDPYNENNTEEKGEPVNKVLSPDESKKYLVETGNEMLGLFNSADQKSAVKLVEGIAWKMDNYDWDMEEVADYFDEGIEAIFAAPKYMAQVAAGKRSPMKAPVYTYAFSSLAAVFEANDKTHVFEYKGKAEDGVFVARMKSYDGTQCELKCWGEGTVKSYSYTYYVGEEVEERYSYLYSDPMYVYVGEGHGMYERSDTYNYYATSQDDMYNYVGKGNGSYDRMTSSDAKYSSVYNEFTGEYEYVYSEYGGEYVRYMRYETEYSEEPFPGAEERTVQVDMPEKIHCTFAEEGKTIMDFEQKLDLEEGDHYYLSGTYRFVNIVWAQKYDVTYEKIAANMYMKYGDRTLISADINLPSYKMLQQQEGETYEEYGERIEDRWESLVSQVGEVTAEVKLLNRVQMQARVSNMGDLYAAYMDWEDEFDAEMGDYLNKAAAKALCKLYNNYCIAGIYYNSDVLQAQMEMEIYDTERESDAHYDIEPVIMFPSDGTTYSYGQYFSENRFGSVIDLAEDVANSYIRLLELFDVDRIELR